MITVGIVDDEVLIRAGVRGVLEQTSDIRVVAEAGDGNGAVTLTRDHRPQVVLMDIRMPGMDGVAATKLVRQMVPATQVLMLAAMSLDEHIMHALRAGAAGYLVKNGDPRELISGVRAVAAGESALSPGAARCLVNHVCSCQGQRAYPAPEQIHSLTTRERDVLIYLAQGLGNREIANALFLSESAIKAYVSRLLHKLRCDNRVQAALVAHTSGLIN